MKIAFNDLYHLNKSFEEKFLLDVKEIFQTSSFVGGRHVDLFEEKFANETGNDYCVSTSSGTDSLSIILRALEINPEDGVIYYPANTFIGSILGALQMGYRCKPYDVSFDTFNANIESFSSIGTDASVVIAVHLYGYGLENISYLKDFCQKRNIILLEDCSQSHFQKYENGMQVSNFSKASYFSMYPGKNFGAAGQAGAICTNDKELSKIMKAIRNYGAPKKYEHTFKGFNYRMDAIQASFLCHKFPAMEREIERRREIASFLLKNIKHESINLMKIKPNESVWHIFPIYSRERDSLINHLSKSEIEVGIHYPKSSHQFDCWKNLIVKGDTTTTDILSQGILSLPCHGGMSDDQVEYLVEAINEFSR
jgi:dTDP-4-amino-4,6-dideoxygalactose transaminase